MGTGDTSSRGCLRGPHAPPAPTATGSIGSLGRDHVVDRSPLIDGGGVGGRRRLGAEPVRRGIPCGRKRQRRGEGDGWGKMGFGSRDACGVDGASVGAIDSIGAADGG